MPIPPSCGAIGGWGGPGFGTVVTRNNGGRRLEGAIGPVTIGSLTVGSRLISYDVTVIDGPATLIGGTTANRVYLSGADYSTTVGEEFLMATGQSHGQAADSRLGEYLTPFDITVPAGAIAVVSTLTE